MRNHISDYMGIIKTAYVGYSNDPDIRKYTASGGVASAICHHLLHEQIVSCVLASRLNISSGTLKPEVLLAEKVAELKDCKNSLYFYYHIGSQKRFRNVIELMKQGERVAVVGLYCHLKTLDELMRVNRVPSERCIKIGLFCSHAPDIKLIYKAFNKQNIDLKNVRQYITKSNEGGKDGRLHDKSTVIFNDGSIATFPLRQFKTYKNAWFYTRNLCLACPDQFAENADFSCGDAWYKEIRAYPYKFTTILARNDEAGKIISDMKDSGLITLKRVDPLTVLHSQSKVTAVAKVALPARTKLARLFGIKLPKVEGSSGIIAYIHSFFVLTNVKWSRSKVFEKYILKVPFPIIFGYVLFIKALEKLMLQNLPKGDGVEL